ncbi:response regulator [Effusibacillus dendaii]|uniref:Response regulator n=1 Tax=Effusibacillus dendaii TaxID=2743772 RepID=A0A7I8DCU7_9BACL|nr:response regulator [Effusibacillus dendaii]BCJ87925.1 response regulator [Effusibacillus dendaii]
MAKILITDDSLFARKVLARILQKAGHMIVGEAKNGIESIEKYKQLRPDLVTMDITMPEMDGMSALKEIKKTDPDAIVIMCTAMGQSFLISEAILEGAQDFIIKPYSEQAILKAIENSISKQT